MVDVDIEDAAWALPSRDKEVGVIYEARKVGWLNWPVCYVELACLEVAEHTCEVVVDLVQEVVHAWTESRPV